MCCCFLVGGNMLMCFFGTFEISKCFFNKQNINTHTHTNSMNLWSYAALIMSKPLHYWPLQQNENLNVWFAEEIVSDLLKFRRMWRSPAARFVLSKDACFVEGCLLCRRIYGLSKDACFVKGFLFCRRMFVLSTDFYYV